MVALWPLGKNPFITFQVRQTDRQTNNGCDMTFSLGWGKNNYAATTIWQRTKNHQPDGRSPSKAKQPTLDFSCETKQATKNRWSLDGALAGTGAPSAAAEEHANNRWIEIRASAERLESIFIQRWDNCEAVIKLVCHFSFHYSVEPGWKWSKKAPFSSRFHFLYDSE